MNDTGLAMRGDEDAGDYGKEGLGCRFNCIFLTK